MGFDLDKIPTTQGGGPDKPSGKPPGGFDLSKIPGEVAGTDNLPGAPTGMSFDDFRFQPKTHVDNYLLRAQDQAWWEQGLKMVGNGLANTVTGVIEGFGYLPELFDSAHDYSNALTRTMQDAHNPFGEIHREQPNEVFDLSDPAWWFSNIQMLGESAAAFGIQGIGLAKLFGTAARGAATAMGAARAGRMVANGAAQIATATTLAYTEGAMSGYRIYEEAYKSNYDKAIRNGKNEQEAEEIGKSIAGKAAATTVRMNTMMNTVLNLGALSPFFKNPTDEVMHFMKTTGARGANESMAAWRSRIKAYTMDNPELKQQLIHREGWSSLAAESGKEGVEEINTQYAEAEGRRVAAGGERSMTESLTDMGQYFADVTNEEGALNFVLGAFGGVAQTAIVDNLRSRSILKYDDAGKPIVKQGEDGKVMMKGDKPVYETQLVTPRSYNEFGVRKFFENIRDGVVKDIDYMERKQQDLLMAAANNNHAQAEVIRNEIFSVGALDAVTKGLTPSFQKMYEDIDSMDNKTTLGEQMQPQIDELLEQARELMEAGDQDGATAVMANRQELMAQQVGLMDTTEAMQKGFTTSMNDNSYQDRAKAAVQDLKHLDELHQTINKKYADSSVPASAEVVDHLFFRHADLYLKKRAIEREEARIRRMEALEEGRNLISTDLFNLEIGKYNDQLDIQNAVMHELKADATQLQLVDAKGDLAHLRKLIEKYRAQGTSDQDITGAINDLVTKLNSKIKQYADTIEQSRDTLESSTGFTTWKEANPTGTFADYTQQVGNHSLAKEDRKNLESVKVQHEIATQNLADLSKEKGIANLVKAFATEKKNLIASINERNKKENLDNMLHLQSKKAAAALDPRQKAILIEQLQQQLAGLTAELKTALGLKTTADTELKTALNKGKGLFSNLGKIIGLRENVNRRNMIVSSLRGRINTVQEELNLLVDQKKAAEVKQTKAENLTIEDLTDTEVDLNEDVELDQFEEAAQSPAKSDLSVADLTATAADQSLDPIGDYMALKQTLPPIALSILDKLEKRFTGQETSYHETTAAFQELINRGVVSLDQVNTAFFALREFLLEKARPVEQPTDNPAELISTPAPLIPDATAPTEDVITTDDIPKEEPSGQPVIDISADMFTQDGLTKAAWEDSAKTTNAVKANSADLQYQVAKKGTRAMLRNTTQDGAPLLSESANLDRMVPGIISAGDAVILQVDRDWTGTINNDHSLELDDDNHEIRVDDTFSNYVNRDTGKIPTEDFQQSIGFGNVPIKIIHVKTGKIIGYLPRVDWITATQDALTYRNVEDQFPAVDGVRAPGNVAEQARINLQIRKRLSEMYNQNPDAQLSTRVSDRTNGRLMYAGDLVESSGRVKYKHLQTNKLLPDPKLEFAVVTKDGIMVGKKVKADVNKVINLSKEQIKSMMGAPVVLLPLPNGKFQPAPLSTVQFSQRQGDVNTIIRAIELYLQHGTKDITDAGTALIEYIETHTGFDIRSEVGLNDFIQQYYTHTSNFQDTITQADAKVVVGEKKQAFMIAIPSQGKSSKKALIKVGIKYSGQKPVYAQLVHGKLDSRFVDFLREGLNKRFKNVAFTDGNIIGVNHKRKTITTVMINKNDVPSKKHYNSYNEYLKSFTSTSVYGLHQVNGQYVYSANSQVLLNSETLVTSPTELISSTNPLSAGEVSSSPVDVLDALESFNLDVRPQQRSVIQPEGMFLNLSNLSDIHRFTPKSDRNDKTPAQVLKYLTKLGINQIADGYNPFLKCS